MKFRILAAVIASGLAFVATPASAQATRTWVSGVGDDANPCSRTAPCKTFAGAISKTATGGEINCLDPAGFGGLTIIKSISIVCDFTEGGILSAGAGVNGFIINLPNATDTVFLSGLDFNGAGNAQNGIRIVSGGNVTVQNSVIRNYRASNGLGMSVQPAGVLVLNVENTTIADNGTGATGGGMLIQPTGAGGTARVALTNVRFQNNSNNNLFVNTTGNTNTTGLTVEVENSTFAGSGAGIRTLRVGGTNTAAMMVNNSLIANNTTVGITADGGQNTIRVGNSTITGNTLGVSPVNGGVINSFGTNRLIGNPTVGAANNGTFSGAVIPES